MMLSVLVTVVKELNSLICTKELVSVANADNGITYSGRSFFPRTNGKKAPKTITTILTVCIGKKGDKTMKLYELFLHNEIQSEYKVVCFDYKQEKRIEVAEEEHTDKDIDYLYVEDGILYIEIDIDED